MRNRALHFAFWLTASMTLAAIADEPMAPATDVPNPSAGQRRQILLQFKLYEIDLDRVSNGNLSVEDAALFEEYARTNAAVTSEKTLDTESLEKLKDVLDQLCASHSMSLLAEPTIVARDGKRAWFASGGEVPYLNVTSRRDWSIDYLRYGTEIGVIPHTQSDGSIKLELKFDLSELQDVNDANSDIVRKPKITARTFRAEARLAANQSLVAWGQAPYDGDATKSRSSDERRHRLRMLVVTPESVARDTNQPEVIDDEADDLDRPATDRIAESTRSVPRESRARRRIFGQFR